MDGRRPLPGGAGRRRGPRAAIAARRAAAGAPPLAPAARARLPARAVACRPARIARAAGAAPRAHDPPPRPPSPPPPQTLAYDVDLLHPPAALEARKHKLKRLVQSPNSFFMDVKCQGCFQITTVFSNSQTVVVCPSCSAVLCTPTGGKARLTEGCSFRRKGD